MILTIKGSTSHRMPLQGWETLTPLFLNSNFNQLIMPCYQNEQNHPRESLLNSARDLERQLLADAPLFPYRYQTEFTLPGTQIHSKSSGGIGGIRINGNIFTIDAGAGICVLKEIQVGSNGKGAFTQTTDIRNLKELPTDNFGIIKIHRKKLRVTFTPQLQKLISFLEAIPDGVVRILVKDRDYSTKELVRLLHEDPSLKDGIEEEFFNRGIAAREELLRMFPDRTQSKYAGTIAAILLMVFNSPESRSAIEGLAINTKSPKLGKQLSVLLAAFK